MKKKIVLMVPSLKNGGAERVVSRLSVILSSHYDLFIVVFDDTNIDYICDAPIVSLDEKSKKEKNILIKLFRSIRRIYKYWIFKRKNNIDLTYSFIDSANIVNILSFGKDKKVTSIRGFASIKSKGSLVNKLIYRSIYKFIHKKADNVVCVSKGIQNEIISEYDLERKKTSVIYNGYNLEEIRELSNIDLSSKLQMEFNNKFVYITIGSYRYEKGLWHLIKAFSSVHKKNPETLLVILGRGNSESESKILHLIKALNLESSVLLPGFDINVYKYLASSSVYVLSSISEGFPNGMVEAMSCGLPVIATDCKTGPREILSINGDINKQATDIEYLEYGIIVPVQSPVEDYESINLDENETLLANAMMSISGDYERLDKYRSKSKERIKDYSYDNWLNMHLNLFQTLFSK